MRSEPAEPVESRPPQHIEEHRLGLVVGRVPDERIRGQDVVPRRPRPRFEVGTGTHHSPGGAELRAEPLGRNGDHLSLRSRPRP